MGAFFSLKTVKIVKKLFMDGFFTLKTVKIGKKLFMDGVLLVEALEGAHGHDKVQALASLPPFD